ncbi:MAG: hypothetical protein IPN36_05370 [Bacteroidetes bacterium]|nr:hypothetical protein [Bacteroidota bacterium]MBL0095953.1 hypothetical protein [Bacteroidota bacterium]
MLVKNSDNQSFIHANDAQWEKFVGLKNFFSEFQLPAGYEAVYAYIETAEDNTTLVELRVVTGFPQELVNGAYKCILSHLGEGHSYVDLIKIPGDVGSTTDVGFYSNQN